MALTPPRHAAATAESSAARRGDPLRLPVTSGTSSHGASATGQLSAELVPIVLSMRGARAKASAATSRDAGVPALHCRSSTSIPP